MNLYSGGGWFAQRARRLWRPSGESGLMAGAVVSLCSVNKAREFEPSDLKRRMGRGGPSGKGKMKLAKHVFQTVRLAETLPAPRAPRTGGETKLDTLDVEVR